MEIALTSKMDSISSSMHSGEMLLPKSGVSISNSNANGSATLRDRLSANGAPALLLNGVHIPLQSVAHNGQLGLGVAIPSSNQPPPQNNHQLQIQVQSTDNGKNDGNKESQAAKAASQAAAWTSKLPPTNAANASVAATITGAAGLAPIGTGLTPQSAAALASASPSSSSNAYVGGRNDLVYDASTGTYIQIGVPVDPRPRNKRRKVDELDEREVWKCSNLGCDKSYKRTSTVSINAHKKVCKFNGQTAVPNANGATTNKSKTIGKKLGKFDADDPAQQQMSMNSDMQTAMAQQAQNIDDDDAAAADLDGETEATYAPNAGSATGNANMNMSMAVNVNGVDDYPSSSSLAMRSASRAYAPPPSLPLPMHLPLPTALPMYEYATQTFDHYPSTASAAMYQHQQHPHQHLQHQAVHAPGPHSNAFGSSEYSYTHPQHSPPNGHSQTMMHPGMSHPHTHAGGLPIPVQGANSNPAMYNPSLANPSNFPTSSATPSSSAVAAQSAMYPRPSSRSNAQPPSAYPQYYYQPPHSDANDVTVHQSPNATRTSVTLPHTNNSLRPSAAHVSPAAGPVNATAMSSSSSASTSLPSSGSVSGTAERFTRPRSANEFRSNINSQAPTHSQISSVHSHPLPPPADDILLRPSSIMANIPHDLHIPPGGIRARMSGNVAGLIHSPSPSSFLRLSSTPSLKNPAQSLMSLSSSAQSGHAEYDEGADSSHPNKRAKSSNTASQRSASALAANRPNERVFDVNRQQWNRSAQGSLTPPLMATQNKLGKSNLSAPRTPDAQDSGNANPPINHNVNANPNPASTAVNVVQHTDSDGENDDDGDDDEKDSAVNRKRLLLASRDLDEADEPHAADGDDNEYAKEDAEVSRAAAIAHTQTHPHKSHTHTHSHPPATSHMSDGDKSNREALSQSSLMMHEGLPIRSHSSSSIRGDEEGMRPRSISKLYPPSLTPFSPQPPAYPPLPLPAAAPPTNVSVLTGMHTHTHPAHEYAAAANAAGDYGHNIHNGGGGNVDMHSMSVAPPRSNSRPDSKQQHRRTHSALGFPQSYSAASSTGIPLPRYDYNTNPSYLHGNQEMYPTHSASSGSGGGSGAYSYLVSSPSFPSSAVLSSPSSSYPYSSSAYTNSHSLAHSHSHSANSVYFPSHPSPTPSAHSALFTQSLSPNRNSRMISPNAFRRNG